MEIVLIRHGEPAWVVDGRTVQDPALTSLGIAQAQSAAHRLATLDRVDEVIVSPALRAQQTAEPIERALRLTATIVSDLTEIRVPWGGTPAHIVEAAFAEARDRPVQDWWDGLSGGESFRDFHQRVTGAVAALLRQRGVEQARDEQHLWHDDGSFHRIVIVAHGGTNAVALGFLLGLDATPWEWERFVSKHAAFIRVRTVPLAGAHIMSLHAANDTAHLSQEYLTG